MADRLGRRFLVYCVERREDGLFMLKNRSYKDLGDPVAIPRLTKKQVEAMSVHQSFSNDGKVHAFWLFNDASNPMISSANMNAYMNRMAKLMMRTCRPG